MASSERARTPQERETLLFANPEAAQSFRETVAERLSREQEARPERQQAMMGQVVAEEFAAAGEGVGIVREPWTHTEAEHAEVQQLVEVAFSQDLAAALKQARQSQHYPRNIDLLHDVLTGELYDILRQEQLNRQPVATWLIFLLAILLLIVLASLFIWIR